MNLRLKGEKIMKKNKIILAAAVVSFMMTGCGQGASSGDGTRPETNTVIETKAETGTKTETGIKTEVKAQAESDKKAGSKELYEDNFVVDSEAAAAFGSEIKRVVADKNLDSLADLVSYPVYVGFSDGGKFIETRDDLIALGAEKIFTDDLVESITASDENSLTPSMAGFALSRESGEANILFGIVEGKLAVVGINYKK